jgi:CheY-like chemotaxis protein
MEDARAAPEVRVLVVDDNVDAATSLGYLLQLMGAKTAVAFGGDMALRLARLFQPMLILVDLRMPGLDGCQVMREARALPGVDPDTLFACFSATRGLLEQLQARASASAAPMHRLADALRALA